MPTSLLEGQEDEKPLSEAPPSEVGFSFPRWLRWVLFAVLAVIFLVSVALVVGYAFFEKAAWEPSKLDIVDLVIFCLVGLVICMLPWEKYRVRLTKIGPFEFEQILSAQAREHVETFNELRQRIQALERTHGEPGKKASLDSRNSEDLKQLLRRFLTEYCRSISLLLIVTEGPKRPGFEKLGNVEKAEIRRVLQELVAEGIVEVRISQKGNTLYRIAR